MEMGLVLWQKAGLLKEPEMADPGTKRCCAPDTDLTRMSAKDQRRQMGEDGGNG